MTILADDRGRRGRDYTLLTPANRYTSRLPNLPGAMVFKLVTPRLAPARFGQYLVAAGEQGLSFASDVGVSAEGRSGFEHFLFGRSGQSTVSFSSGSHRLSQGGFAYFGPDQHFSVDAEPNAEIIWIKRRYEAVAGLGHPPEHFGSLSAVDATPTAVAGLMRRELIDPTNPAFDFNVSHMEFGPEVGLPQIEIHDEEHGLYMTAGGGLYHLDGDELQVWADDFIYMGPYCAQGFRAGASGASYLLYKDVYRDGF